MNRMHIDFKHLKRPDSPNYYLACASNCCNINADISVPDYPVSVEKLKAAWDAIIQKQARFQLIASNVKLMQYQYIQKSCLFSFEDYVTVRFYAINNKQSSLALLSFSKTGYYDFGVNKKRINHLLDLLNKQLQL